MTERRPHWDDDLLAAVLRYLHDPAPLTDDDRAWNIVEAVEDWQEREKTRCKSDKAYHCATHDTQWLDDESDRCEYKRMVDAEATIARVREVFRDPSRRMMATSHMHAEWVDLNAILDALGGDSE